METYKKLVDYLFRNKSDRIIANSSDAHAAVLFEAFFKYAEKEICIFCECLNKKIFDNSGVLENAKIFLEKNNTCLLIGITANQPEPSAFFELLRSIKSDTSKEGKVRVMRFPKMTANGKFINFAVMDDCGYRYEPDYHKCAAIASANDAPFAAKLKKAFFECLPKPKSEQKNSTDVQSISSTADSNNLQRN